MVHTARLEFATRGNTEVLDITLPVAEAVLKSGVKNGIVVAFVIGSTASITTTEAEPGLMTNDLKSFFERIAPENLYYKHEETWNDDNGHAHVRASCVGPSVSIPLIDSRLCLGEWQQLVLLDFDTRARKRDVIVQVVGE